MKINLFIKFYTAILFVLFLILIIFGFLNVKDQKNSSLMIMKAQSELIASSLFSLNAEAILSYDNAVVVENSLEFIKNNKNIKYIILSRSNNEKLLIYGDKWIFANELEDEYKILEKEDSKYKLLKMKFMEEDTFHYVSPINVASFNWGWFHFGFSLDEYNKSIDSIYRNLIFVAIISFFTLAIFVYIFTRWLLKPIFNLNAKTKEIASGNYVLLPKLDRKDELSELTQNFNIMVRSLRKSKKAIDKSKEELEQKVDERTKALRDINKTLDKRINKEVDKRRKQDKYLHEQLKMAQMGEMLNNIAHQWRQPLSVITTAISSLKLKKDLSMLEDKDIEENYELVINNAKYLTKTIDSFSRYTEDNSYIENIDLKELINELLILNKDALKNNFIKVELDMPSYTTLIKTKPTSLTHVLLNLLLNANTAFSSVNTLKEKLIFISLYKHEDSFVITIEDNAGGIDEKIISKVFEPYFTTNVGSKGLGLYLSYDLVVNQLRGKINVRNSSLGAVFTIVLPMSV